MVRDGRQEKGGWAQGGASQPRTSSSGKAQTSRGSKKDAQGKPQKRGEGNGKATGGGAVRGQGEAPNAGGGEVLIRARGEGESKQGKSKKGIKGKVGGKSTDKGKGKGSTGKSTSAEDGKGKGTGKGEGKGKNKGKGEGKGKNKAKGTCKRTKDGIKSLPEAVGELLTVPGGDLLPRRIRFVKVVLPSRCPFVNGQLTPL
jgi:hypothetical protein